MSIYIFKVIVSEQNGFFTFPIELNRSFEMSSFVETLAMSVLKESPVEFVKYPLILAQENTSSVIRLLHVINQVIKSFFLSFYKFFQLNVDK